MKHRPSHKTVDDVFNEQPVPPPEEMQARIGRVWNRVQTEIQESAERPASIYVSIPRPWMARRRALAIALSTLTIIAAGLAGVFIAKRWNDVFPTENVASTAWTETVSMNQIDSRQVFQSDDRTGGTLILPDESRVELSTRTELSLERATDGLRILLEKGSILINAAKQRDGHLYVETKDLAVSVVGTVFLVRAEPQGSRVAVIEGEVRVQKGTATEKLLPGEQVATTPSMSTAPVVEEISWSQHAKEHFALLQQSIIPAALKPAEPSETFDVTSIRRNTDTATGNGARGGGGGVPVALPCPTANVFEMDLLFQLNPGRLSMKRQSLYGLIAIAYGNSCPAPDTITGGNDWMKADHYDVQAIVPAGTQKYSKEELLSGNAPQLQRMLRNMLADRFQLVLKREVRETQGYNLVVAQKGKLKVSGDQTADQPPPQVGRGGALGAYPVIPTMAAPISRLIRILQRELERPIVDKTGLTGLFDVWLEFPEIPLPSAPPDGATPSDIQRSLGEIRSRLQELLPAKLEGTTGLRLEPAKVPVEVFVIVSAERPSEN